MKIICEKARLAESIAPAMGCVSNKNTMQPIEGLRFKALGGICEVSAYDLEKGCKFLLDCEIEEEGDCIINAVKLNQIVRAMPEGDVVIEVSEQLIASITCGVRRFELHALAGSDFPLMPTLDGEKGFTVSQGRLRRMIIGTDFAVAVNDSRAMLNGAFFEATEGRLKVISCDGNRLACREFNGSVSTSVNSDISNDFGFIVPGRTLDELVKMLGDGDEETTIVATRRHAMFVIGRLIFITRLIESDYIEYDRYIPKSFKGETRVMRDELISSLESASLVTEEKISGHVRSPVRLDFSGGLIKVSTVSVAGRVYDEVQALNSGDSVEIAFNCRLLLEALRRADSDEIIIKRNSAISSIVILPADTDTEDKDENYLLLVLPTRS